MPEVADGGGDERDAVLVAAVDRVLVTQAAARVRDCLNGALGLRGYQGSHVTYETTWLTAEKVEGYFIVISVELSPQMQTLLLQQLHNLT